MSSRSVKIAAALVAATVLAGSATDAMARPRFGHGPVMRHGFHRGRGVGGAAVAGAALGIIGLAAGAAAANHYYNGYPDYYGPGPGYYGPGPGYDYGY